ncbi:BlaI/MecI/CopY family transcriptional regulator [Aliikangiella sp. G2MR2-5]|uniref:BlaI/MecI/CopY family transcriptional regulator n=1 Tax=Aliikangiella sp. G2MR2-5 TaxID=2788943 RepID=UPI0018A8C39D|nr:BlaI/MecI/CopY family transcriptional regulator [Aliikangiella sp. G2MR2-5]
MAPTNSKSAKPSTNELAILKSLWRQSPMSAREVHETTGSLKWSFSSTRKTLERMLQKGMLTQEELHGVKVFSPAVSKVKTLASFVKELAFQVLEVDKELPVSMFADSKLLDDGELKELEMLLNEKEESDD